MIERLEEGSLTWVDVVSPTTDEIRELMETYDISPELASDWGGPVTRSGAIEQGKIIKATMDFPIVKRTDINRPHEIKFIIAKHTLITIRYEDMEAIHRFRKEFEVLATLHKTKKNTNGIELFMSLLAMLYEALESKLDFIETKLVDVEQEISQEREREMVFEISNISRRLIVFRQVMKAHDDVFRDLKPLYDSQFPKKYGLELQQLHNSHFHISRRTLALFETLEELRNTNSALLTTKQNEIMKLFTILAFITFPLTLFTSMFGMNTITTPIVGSEGDFWLIVGIMGIVSVCFFMYFKYKKWI